MVPILLLKLILGGNAIVKVYISKLQRLDLYPGDLLLFYSSEKNKSIEPIGILLEHRRIDDFNELWSIVKFKTIYEHDVLKNWLK
jgi:hypothetical protein